MPQTSPEEFTPPTTVWVIKFLDTLNPALGELPEVEAAFKDVDDALALAAHLRRIGWKGVDVSPVNLWTSLENYRLNVPSLDD